MTSNFVEATGMSWVVVIVMLSSYWGVSQNALHGPPLPKMGIFFDRSKQVVFLADMEGMAPRSGGLLKASGWDVYGVEENSVDETRKERRRWSLSASFPYGVAK